MGVSAVIAGAGAAASAYGTVQTMNASKEARAAQERAAQEEKLQNQLRRKAMELDARRRNIEQVRQNQRARAMALATTTAQGASGGSALGGAYGQASGMTASNILGTNQSLELGRANFASDDRLSDARLAYSNAQGAASAGAAWSSIGGTAMNVSGTFGNIFGGVTSPFGSQTAGYYGGSPSTNRNLQPFGYA